MQSGQTSQDLSKQWLGIAHGNEFLPLCFRKAARYLGGEDRWPDKLVKGLAVFITQPQRLWRERARDDPAECDGRINDILHESSSSLSNS
jgi:hypothetical protein